MGTDCGDNSDEHACKVKTASSCPPNTFQCESDKTCIPIYYVCDLDNDCVDGSDEVECVFDGCQPDEFNCGNRRCISNRWKCGKNESNIL